jgi:hypothetical protein
VPVSVKACAKVNPKADCTAPDNYFDTALALDLQERSHRVGERSRAEKIVSHRGKV